jgi:hypothetical protein
MIKKWLMTGMASFLDSSSLLKLWELCLTENNLTLPIYVSVAVLYRFRERLMKKSKSKDLLKDDSEIDDIEELIKEALVYQNNTPASFQKNIEKFLFSENPKKSLIASIDAHSLLKVSSKDLESLGFNFVVFDTRDYKEFSKGHLGKSINLPSDNSITTGK